MTRKIGSLELHFKDLNDHDNAVIMDREPDHCPVCGNGIQALFIEAHGKTDQDRGHFVQSIFKCPIKNCQAVFIAYYTSASWGGRVSRFDENVFLRKTYIRAYHEEEKFDDEILYLSPLFVEIFTESNNAENLGFENICGAGYRKALEYLIKDYLKLTKPDLSDEIEGHMLGYVIAHYVENENIKKTAGLAGKVGNDETHYIKKIEELSLIDLKKLIRITTHWIVDELLTKKYSSIYEKLMQSDKK